MLDNTIFLFDYIGEISCIHFYSREILNSVQEYRIFVCLLFFTTFKVFIVENFCRYFCTSAVVFAPIVCAHGRTYHCSFALFALRGRKLNKLEIEIEGTIIRSSKSIKYLRVHFGRNLRFMEHSKKLRKKYKGVS